MAAQNPYEQYSNNRIMTASPAELTLMLYDGAIKFGNIAITAIEQKDIPKAHTNIIKMQKIIDYLRQTLDMKYPVAKDFDNIYTYLSRRLVQANIKKDKDILEEVNGHLRSVRDNWKEVMRVNKEKGSV
ncbi:MAG: flagellar export chaperone FliS [Lachnospiraceae bacterium]|nr:flagellar export chaperone FliS [Lachnospiraceae bacterium]